MHLRARKEKQVKTVPQETFCVQAIGVGRRVMKGTKNMVGKEGAKPRHLGSQKSFQKDDGQQFHTPQGYERRNKGCKRVMLFNNLDIFAGL